MSASELVAMKFDQYFSVKLGLPENELPTFGYRIMNNFGVYGDEMFGSIHANFPVDAYAPDVLVRRLREWLGEQLEIPTELIRAEVLLGKPLTVDTVLDYIFGIHNLITIATGVQLCCEGHVGLYTVSRRHRPEPHGEISQFAGDIHKLRKLHEESRLIDTDPNITASGEWSGEMTSIHDLVAKWKKRFTFPEPEVKVDPYSVEGLVQRVLSWQNFDVNIRGVVYRDAKNVEIALGNCSVIINQRTKTLKVTVHVNSDSGVEGAPRHYSAQSPKTIDTALNDILGVEKYGWSSGLGHYNRSRRVQYDAIKLRAWFKKLLKSNCLYLVSNDDAKSDVEIYMGHYSELGTLVGPVMVCLKIFMMHSEISVNVGDGLWNRVCFYHGSCEEEGKRNVLLYLADGLKRNRAVCTV